MRAHTTHAHARLHAGGAFLRAVGCHRVEAAELARHLNAIAVLVQLPLEVVTQFNELDFSLVPLDLVIESIQLFLTLGVQPPATTDELWLEFEKLFVQKLSVLRLGFFVHWD